ncbi:MAG: decaprenyl-phosphate phosphoribosyltransferase [Nevskiales bacterium]
MKAIFALIRPRQWVKNAFVGAPLVFTPDALNPDNALRVLAGFIAFSLVASAVYILNDYMDRETDRLHPAKKQRPLAAGSVSLEVATLLFAALMAAGIGLAYALGYLFFLLVMVYLGINIAYSVWLKRVAIVDLLCVAVGFVLRVEAGSILINVESSVWILNCTGLLAMFIILAKRRDDLVRDLDQTHRASLGGYNLGYLDVCIAMVLGALLVAYMMYATDLSVGDRLHTGRLYLTVPFVLAGIMRYLQITLVEKRSGSPTIIVTSDPFMILSITGWMAMIVALVYF